MFSPESDSFEYSVEGLLGCTPLIWVKPKHNVRLKYIRNKHNVINNEFCLSTMVIQKTPNLWSASEQNAEVSYLINSLLIKFIYTNIDRDKLSL